MQSESIKIFVGLVFFTAWITLKIACCLLMRIDVVPDLHALDNLFIFSLKGKRAILGTPQQRNYRTLEIDNLLN